VEYMEKDSVHVMTNGGGGRAFRLLGIMLLWALVHKAFFFLGHRWVFCFHSNLDFSFISSSYIFASMLESCQSLHFYMEFSCAAQHQYSFS
jgi:hypothetical protein